MEAKIRVYEEGNANDLSAKITGNHTTESTECMAPAKSADTTGTQATNCVCNIEGDNTASAKRKSAEIQRRRAVDYVRVEDENGYYWKEEIVGWFDNLKSIPDGFRHCSWCRLGRRALYFLDIKGVMSTCIYCAEKGKSPNEELIELKKRLVREGRVPAESLSNKRATKAKYA